MSESTQSTSGANQTVSDQTENQTQTKPKDTVSYETYSKVLGEKKKVAEKLEALEAQLKQKVETELKEKEDYKKLLELREKELNESKSKLGEFETTFTNSQKMQAFLKHIPGELEQDYWQLIDLDKITINPDTKKPDEASVMAYAKEFSDKFKKVIQSPVNQKLPNNAVDQTNSNLTYESWLKMPLDEKKKHQKQIQELLKQKYNS